MIERENIQVIVAKEHFMSGSHSLKHFVNLLSNQVDFIPAEHRDDATIEFDTLDIYPDEDAVMRITISYSRPEDDFEMAAREKEIADRVNDERRLYKRLKAKYEGA
jgi:hypothetical protein